MSFEKIELGEYIKVQGGYAYKSDDFNDDGDFPVIKIKNVRFGEVDYSEASYISSELADETIDWKTNEGDILISMTGSGPNAPNSLVGRVARIWEGEPDGWINQRVGRICVNEENEIHPDFIFYLLSSFDTQYYLVSNSTGSANQANISGKLIESILCPRVDYETSERIADQLRVLDQKIHLNQQTNETLEAMAQAIFKSWFVDFDPVRAKMEAKSAGRDPNRAAMAVIAGISLDQDWVEAESVLDQKLSGMTESQRQQLTRTAQLFQDELEEREIGEVPKGWEVVEYKSITKVLNGYAFKSKDYLKDDSGVFVLRTKNFGDNGLVERLSDDVYLPNNFLNEYSKYVCESYDLQMVMVGASLGKLGMILPFQLPALRNQNMWCFRAKKENHKFFVDHYLKWSVPKMLSFASGSARSFFRKGDFQKMDVILPPEKLIAKFNELVEPFYHRIATNESEVEALSKLRDTLLPKLISGEVGV